MLTLPIKRKWLDMILCGEKTEEYRAMTDYYKVRFRNVPHFECDGKSQFYVLLRAGYSRQSVAIAIRCWVDTGTGKQEWGAEPNVAYFRLHITWKRVIFNYEELGKMKQIAEGKRT